VPQDDRERTVSAHHPGRAGTIALALRICDSTYCNVSVNKLSISPSRTFPVEYDGVTMLTRSPT
jgi:hypothetical protein